MINGVWTLVGGAVSKVIVAYPTQCVLHYFVPGRLLGTLGLLFANWLSEGLGLSQMMGGPTICFFFALVRPRGFPTNTPN